MIRSLANVPPPKEKKLRVSYTFGIPDTTKHCFGINSLASNSQTSSIYSAGRDSTIRCWNIREDPVHSKKFEHHTDWVNDILLCNNNKTLVSCSSDTTIKLWDTESEDGSCLRTFNQHKDYVKCLAYSKETNLVASAGLDSCIYIWDMEVGSPVVDCLDNDDKTSNVKVDYPLSCQSKESSSIYSLAMSQNGGVMVSGATDNFIRGWDPRSAKKLFSLKGHKDNIKALMINDTGTKCLSASSDSTVRLWDLGLQKCIKAFQFHDDSVWALATYDWNYFFSGGRDGSVFCTDMVTQESFLFCRDESPILKLHLIDDSLWQTTTKPIIKKWRVEDLSTLKEKASDDPLTPVNSEPLTSIHGRPGLVKHHILNNRRHILTKDDIGNVQLWDITSTHMVEDFGIVPIEEKSEQLFEMVSIPNWFSLDTKTGSITVHLDNPQCFNAEAYANDAGLSVTQNDETIINFGEKVISALFRNWLKGHKLKPPVQPSQLPTLVFNRSLVGTNPSAKLASVSPKSSAKESLEANDKEDGDVPGAAADSKPEKEEEDTPDPSTIVRRDGIDTKPVDDCSYEVEPTTTVIISEETGIVLRTQVAQMTGNEEIPPWVQRCVSLNHYTSGVSQKITFRLLPFDEKDLPKIVSNPKLSAMRIAKIRKLINHVIGKLGIQLPTTSENEKGSVPDEKERKPEETCIEPENYIQILCNNKEVPPEMTLATVKTFMWKSGDELQLFYRRAPAFTSSPLKYAKK